MKNEISARHMKQDRDLASPSAHEMILWSLKDQGFMCEYKIEPGLTTRTWDCNFKNEVELNEELKVEGADCVLAYFPDDVNLQFCHGNHYWSKNGSWNLLFVRRCQLKLLLFPLKRYRCMSIHFSLAWFRKNRAKAYELFRLGNGGGQGVVTMDSINSNEMELVLDMLANCWKKSMGILYIKSLVFQLISNFCERIKNVEQGDAYSCNRVDVIEAIEQTMLQNIGGSLPGLKELASRFSISESSLKRRFREKHGESISTYFVKKKIAHAQFLIEQKNYTISAASQAVGYKSNYQFMLKYKSYVNSLTHEIAGNIHKVASGERIG
jgi:AraC-like DNA-binding protein